jgi:succinate dehydrogenase / fumarate reductase membrane anchor subunit
MTTTNYHYERRRERQRPGSTFEFYAWFFMRVSGVVLLGVAVFHLLYMHVAIGVDNINFNVIVGRWTGPLGVFWRLYDLFLLIFAMVHGFNGSRYVIDDYIKRPGWRIAFKTVSGTIAFMLWVIGLYIIFTFRPTGA